jgi:hypothetical protein
MKINSIIKVLNAFYSKYLKIFLISNMQNYRVKILIILLIIFLINACKLFEIDEEISQDEIDKILKLEVVVDSSSVEPLVKLKALITANVNDNKNRVIEFETNNGEFISSESGKKKIEQTSNINGVVEAIIKSNGISGNYVVSAKLKEFPSIKSISTIVVPVPKTEKVLDFTIVKPQPELKANGLFIIELKAKVDASYINTQEKTVIFKHNIDGGTFLETNPTEVSVKAVNGIATTFLRIGTQPGSFLISAEIKDIGFKKTLPIDLLGLSSDEVITIQSVDSLGIKADNKSTIKVKLKINNSPLKKIIISSNLGVFVDIDPSNLSLDANNEAEVFFKISQSVEPHKLTIKVAHLQPITKIITINPQRAFANNLFLTSDNYSIPIANISNAIIKLTATLIRESGSVSEKTKVDFIAYQINDQNEEVMVGTFDNLFESFTTAQKTPEIKYRLVGSNQVNPSKPIFIRASTLNDAGEKISNQKQIVITQ